MSHLETIYAEIKKHGTPENYRDILEAINEWGDYKYRLGADMVKSLYVISIASNLANSRDARLDAHVMD